MKNTKLTRVGSESRSETKTYTEVERDSLARDFTAVQSQIKGIDASIKAEYEQREQALIALQNQKETLEKQAATLQPAILEGTVTEVYQCDVYEDGQNRIVVRSGFEPDDPAGLVETTPLATAPGESDGDDDDYSIDPDPNQPEKF